MGGKGKGRMFARSGGVPPSTSESRDKTRGVSKTIFKPKQKNENNKKTELTPEERVTIEKRIKELEEEVLRVQGADSNSISPSIQQDPQTQQEKPVSPFELIMNKVKSIEDRLSAVKKTEKKKAVTPKKKNNLYPSRS